MPAIFTAPDPPCPIGSGDGTPETTWLEPVGEEQYNCPRTSTRSLLADLANLRAHNERLRHHNTKLTQRLSEVLGDDAFRTAGLTQPDDSQALRTR